MERWPVGLEAMAYGGDYTPEQWPAEVWVDDRRLMRSAGVTMVSVGIFAWSLLEPDPGRYEFDWLDHQLDLLHADGIRVDLGTPTVVPPAWFYRGTPRRCRSPGTGSGLSSVAAARSAPARRRTSRRPSQSPSNLHAGTAIIPPSRCGTSTTSTAHRCVPATATPRPRPSAVAAQPLPDDQGAQRGLGYRLLGPDLQLLVTDGTATPRTSRRQSGPATGLGAVHQ